jgi:hypothetical protein
VIRAGILAFALLGCAALGSAPVDAGKAAADAHAASVAACRAYHAAVALGVKPSDAADKACEAAQGLCGND